MDETVKGSKRTRRFWCDENLYNLQKMTREPFNICCNHKYWQPHKTTSTLYINAITTAKIWFRLYYYQSIKNISDSERLSKNLLREYRNSFLPENHQA